MLLTPPSILYDSDTSSRTKRKRVTFQDNVQQHLCLVENKSKPFFNTSPKDDQSLPKVFIIFYFNYFVIARVLRIR